MSEGVNRDSTAKAFAVSFSNISGICQYGRGSK